MSSGRPEAGFTLLGALFMVAMIGAVLATAAPTWSQARQREREAELAWGGSQFQLAIGLYYQRTPGSIKRFPETLEDLLEDRRYASLQRYLRRIYADPITGKSEWGLVPAPGGGIMGVRSLSEAAPIRQREGIDRYSDWRFVYAPPDIPKPSGVNSPTRKP